MLTKTNYLAYLRCPKQFWLDEHQPKLGMGPDPAAQRRMQIGQTVDQRARSEYPGGVHIPYRPQPEDMAPLTAQVIAEGAEILFQATFTADDLLVKSDILTQTQTGWHLIEVKSSTRVKEDEHLPDVAFQLYVLQKAGLNVTQASLMHLNRQCRFPDLADLFTLTDVTDEAHALLLSIEADIPEIRRILSLPDEPEIRIGRHCTRPRTCPFYNHCWQDVDGLTIYDIPRLKRPKEEHLEATDALYLSDIPADFPLTEKQRGFVDFITQEQINIDRAAIQTELDNLEYPLYFFDFETIDYAIPIFDNCRPYDQVPFQYSCHVLQVDGTLEHHEYLHTTAGDPRPGLVEAVLEDIGPSGSIIAYFAQFERLRLEELAEAYSEHSDQLLDLAGRLWDQLDIFKRYYRHYGFGKSNGLKSVLPVIVPELSYAALAVQDGGQAQVIWEQMIATENTDEKNVLITQLLEYCHLDTLAMVEMHRRAKGTP